MENEEKWKSSLGKIDHISEPDDIRTSKVQYTITKPPKWVGAWNTGEKNLKTGKGYIQIKVTKEPKWLHKVMMKLLLGIWYTKGVVWFAKMPIISI